MAVEIKKNQEQIHLAYFDEKLLAGLLLRICIIWMIPFEEYVFGISFSLFSLWQLKTGWWLKLVKFSFTDILVFDAPNRDPLKFLNLQYFWFTNLMIVFFELPLDFLMRWQSSTSLWEIWMSAALNASIVECSRFLSLILSGIPVISMLFL